MASCKLQVAGSDQYVSRSRANWLISAGRARMANGKLEILEGAAHCAGTTHAPDQASRSPWTHYSGPFPPAGAPRGLSAHRMNGATVNRAGGL